MLISRLIFRLWASSGAGRPNSDIHGEAPEALKRSVARVSARLMTCATASANPLTTMCSIRWRSCSSIWTPQT
jgi:hypothetical protein